ncbi:MAG TPA: ChaN family lipoprotein, partial [Bacteroidales bacterium]|nr:ChaN family lipoprotein [Bacteroidales bacterium]
AKMKTRILTLLLFILFTALKTDKPAYVLFDGDGKQKDYKDLLKAAQDADIILFGELHNNPIAHWLQLELTMDLFGSAGTGLVLGAEMFEHDNSLILNEYISQKIRESNFEKEAKLWDNYATDYRPLVRFARDNDLDFVATNIPRRYAAVVAKDGFEGLDKLSEEAKTHIAPLPVLYDPELNCYRQMLSMGGMGDAHASGNLPRAQAIKDATMAHFILHKWSKGKIFLHFNGAYHSDRYEGICWYLKNGDPKVKILTISTFEQNDLEELDKDSFGLADFIICVDSSMTKTY